MFWLIKCSRSCRPVRNLNQGQRTTGNHRRKLPSRTLFVSFIGWLERTEENQKPQCGRRVYPEEGQVEGSCREGVAQGRAAWRIKHRAISQSTEHAHYGKGHRWAERGIQVYKQHDRGRKQHKDILISEVFLDLGITNVSWREESKFRAEQERPRNWRVGVRGEKIRRKRNQHPCLEEMRREPMEWGL